MPERLLLHVVSEGLQIPTGLGRAVKRSAQDLLISLHDCGIVKSFLKQLKYELVTDSCLPSR